MNWKLVVVGGVVVVALVVVLAMGFGQDPHAVPSVLENRPAPAFSLQTLDGKSVSLASLRGKPVLVNFWASWCEPCKVEHRSLQAAAQAYGDKVQFLGVVYQDTPDNAERYLQMRGNVFPQLVDPESTTALDYGVAGVPETFFIDQQGVIRRKFVGALSVMDIREIFDPLLSPRSQP